MTTFVSFRSDPDTGKRLKVSAASRGVSLQRLMIELVERHLASERIVEPARLANVVSELRACKPELTERGVTGLSVFGSTARGDNRADSDIDLLVEISPESNMSLTGFVRLKARFEEILKRPVDLAERRNLEPRLKTSVERDAVSVF